MVTNGDLPAVVTVDFESFYAQTGRRMLSLAYSLTGSWVDAEDSCRRRMRLRIVVGAWSGL